jgi:hypothetical protein
MPTVDIPGVGLVEFPEDYTGERLNTAAKGVYLRGQQLSARAEGEQPASSQGLDALSRLPAGVQSGTGRTLAGAVRAGDIAATPTFIPFMGGLGPGAETINRLNQQMPAVREEFVRGRPQRLAESTAFQLGREIEQAAAPTFGVDPARDNEFLAQLATAAGEMVPTLAAGSVAGPAGVAFQYGTSAGEAQAQEAIAAGKPEAADIAFLSAAGLGGITEAALGVPGRLLAIANRARKAGVNPGTFGRWANRNPMAAGIARAGAEGALREGAQEGLEQAGQNLIASDVAGYDPNRPVGQGVGRAAALGATLGGVVGGGAAGINQANRNQQAAVLRRLRDGRQVIVNEQTGTTEFPPLEGDELPPPPPPAPPAGPANVPPPIRGEAAMETRPSASWTPDGPRTPAVDPELADAIAAIRAGYNPEVDAPAPAPAPPSTFNLQPSTFPEAPGVPPPLEGQPYDTRLATRPEAAMATRTPPPLDLQREPASLADINDAIATIQQGYGMGVPVLNRMPDGESLTDARRMAALSETQRKFGERLAKKYGSPVAPIVPSTEPYEQHFRLSNMLERAATKSNDPAEIAEILAFANGDPNESQIAWAVLNNPLTNDQTYTQAKKNKALLAMTTEENIGRLDSRRTLLRKQRGIDQESPQLLSNPLQLPAQLSEAGQALNNAVEMMTPEEWATANLSPGLLQVAKTSALDAQALLQPYVDAIREAVKAGRPITAAAWEAGTRAGWPSNLEAKAGKYRWQDGIYSPSPVAPSSASAKVRGKRGAAAGGAGTITGSNERRGSAMPAEAGSTPAPTEADAPRPPQPAKAKASKATAPKPAAAEERPPGLDPLIQVGKQVMVMRSAKSRKLAKAKVHRITPDGITVYYYKDKTFETVPPLKVQPTNAAAGVAAYHAQFQGLSAAERKAAKAGARAFKDLIRNEGWRFGWYDPRVEMGATESKSQGILADEAFDRGLQKALAELRVEPDPDTPDVQLAKLLPRLRDYIEQNTPLAERQNLAWMQATAQPDANDVPVYGNALAIGQTLEVDGEPVKVTAIDPDTGMVTLEDGTKFGTQQLEDDALIYVDKVNPPPAREAVRDDWDAPEPEAKVESPKPAVEQRQLTKAEAREYSDLEDKRRAAQEGGPALTQREAKRYAELTAIAGQQELMAEDASSGKAGRLATLQAKRAELDRLQRLALDRGNAAPYGSNAKEMAYADAASYAKESVRIREEIAALNAPAAQEGELFTASAAYPGGALGTSAAPQPPPPTGSIPPAQDREHSVFPLELPELVRLARMLGQGHFPKLKHALRGGKALGVFRYREGEPDSGRIELARGLWQMVLPEEKADLLRKAEAYAAAMVDETDPAERARVAKAKYEADLEALMDERLKQDPILAVKVLAHEIGHWIDFLPQAMIHGRGNLFGHVASLKKFLRHTITWDPKFAELNETGELTEADRRRLREAARRELEKELGPIREIIEKVLIEEPVFATTGVTPEDVKRLFGMDARETMPELYLWFAGLDAATKKEVVKAAMRGMVDARVPASRVQTGTRTVEREVRNVSGRMPTPEEVAARFQAKLREAMEARRMMDINEVKAQLREAITWWRGAKQFEEYFASPEEMYAEAFSIFLANPAALAQRAPKYFNALLNYMDRKPEAAKAYGDLQLAIRQGTVQQQRDKDLLAGFARDEARFRDRANDRQPPMDWVDNILYHMDRRLGPIYRRARGSKLEGTIRGALGDFNYRGAEHERFLSAINREVSQPLVAANLEWSDLGYYMFHKRVVEHFDQKAVPLGYAPHSSQKALDAKQAELGPARWAALEQAQRNFMALYQSQVVPLLKTSGLTTPELQQLIEDRVFYSTFKAIKDDPKDDIERLLAQAYGSGVGSQIYRRVGNLGEVANPATATLMKALSLMSAAYRNNAKRHLPAMLEEMGLPVREVEKTWDKNLNALAYDTTPLGAASPVQKLVFLENGKPKAYYVEASIAEAFNAGDPIENNLLLGVLAASRGMKRLFTDINYGFWPFAFVRDVAGFGMQMPGMLAPVRYFKNLPKAFAASRDSLKGKPNPLADEALKRKMWIAQADPYGVRDAAENEAELQIAAHGLTPASWERGGYQAKLAAAWEWYRNWGKVLERTHKLNGMLYLDQHYGNLPEWQKQEMVREWAGSPDFLQQPGDRRWINALALFYNPWKESLRSVAKAAKHHPGEFAAKATLGILMPTVLQSLAVMGLLGDDLEEMYKSVGDYDLTNYLVFPFGWEDKAQGKVKYLRFPLWEPARMAHGLLFGQITGRGEKPLSHAGGQVPGLNPLLTATAAWMDYKLRGRNPYDSHYGREILDPDVFKVGGTPADAAMLKWTWNQLGGSVLFRFDTRPELIKNDTPLEKSLKAPGVSNLVGRFLRVSNRGILDADRKVIEPGEQQRARVRLAVDEIKAKLLRREELGQSEHLLLSVDPYARDYLLRTLPEDYLKQQSLLFQRLQRAPNNEAKIKLLTQ